MHGKIITVVMLAALLFAGGLSAQALWKSSQPNRSMYQPQPEEYQIWKKHDLVLVRINERMDAQLRDSLETSREAELNAQLEEYIRFGKNLNLTPGNRELGVAGSADFESTNEGERLRRSRFSDTIMAEITEVLPGYDPEKGEGLFMIRAYKSAQLIDDTQTVALSGRISLKDIRADRSIDSQRIFWLDTVVTGNGDVSNASKQGWLTKALNSLWPF